MQKIDYDLSANQLREKVTSQTKEDRIAYGKYLDQLRNEAGCTQGELARGIGVGQATVSKWLRGEHDPRKTDNAAVAEAFLHQLIEQKADASKSKASRCNTDHTTNENIRDFDFLPIPSIQKSLSDITRHLRAESFLRDLNS